MSPDASALELFGYETQIESRFERLVSESSRPLVERLTKRKTTKTGAEIEFEVV